MPIHSDRQHSGNAQASAGIGLIGGNYIVLKNDTQRNPVCKVIGTSFTGCWILSDEICEVPFVLFQTS